MCIMITDVFYQNYSLSEDGIPPHWAVQFTENGYADYAYFNEYDDAIKFAVENGYDNED